MIYRTRTSVVALLLLYEWAWARAPFSGSGILALARTQTIEWIAKKDVIVRFKTYPTFQSGSLVDVVRRIICGIGYGRCRRRLRRRHPVIDISIGIGICVGSTISISFNYFDVGSSRFSSSSFFVFRLHSITRLSYHTHSLIVVFVCILHKWINYGFFVHAVQVLYVLVMCVLCSPWTRKHET